MEFSREHEILRVSSGPFQKVSETLKMGGPLRAHILRQSPQVRLQGFKQVIGFR